MHPRFMLPVLVLFVAVVPTASAAELPPPAIDPLVRQVDRAIELSSRRFLTARVHSPWQILHGMLALRRDFRVTLDGRRVRAIDWISDGATYNGLPLFEKTGHGGRAHPFTQPYHFEGHPNQFLAILSMSRLSPDHRFRTGTGQIQVTDLVRHAQKTVNDREEITWTLWALSHYLPPDARWVNVDGEPWSIERLVQIQTREPVDEAACGGSHGLFALAYARNMARRRTRGRLGGIWLEADHKVRRFTAEARMLQNPDGTFSASYFAGPHQGRDWSERIETSGHTLEWLLVAVPPETLKSPWLRRGVSAVARDLVEHADEPAECGPLYHALHGLVLYRERTRAMTAASR